LEQTAGYNTGMADELFDEKTIERFRAMGPERAIAEAKDVIYRLGGTTSDDFLDVFEELVRRGVLSWEQVEELEGQPR